MIDGRAFCPQCGASVDRDDRFCRSCGRQREAVAPRAPTPRPRRPRTRILVAVGVVGVALVAIAGAAVLLSPPPVHALTGSVVVTDATGLSVQADLIGCKGSGGFADFEPGITVNVRNEQGTILATGSLGQGALAGATFLPLPADWATNDSVDPLEFGEKVSGCRFDFTIPGMPDRSGLYTIDVGNRKGLTLTRDELAAQSWNISIQLGS